MSKLIYWRLPCLDDSYIYSRRFRTKREAFAEWDRLQAEGERGFGPPEKCILEYEGGIFGALQELTSENQCDY